MLSVFKIGTLASLSILLASGCSSLKTRDRVKSETAGATPSATGPKVPSVGPTPPPPPGSSVEPENPDDDVETGGFHGQPPPDDMVEPDPTAPPPPPPKVPRIGLILGPGGAKTFAHIGVLHEMQKLKIPVHAVAGVEWGSLVAGLYAMKGSSNEAEWQMSKLKDDDVVKKSLIGGASSASDLKGMDEFLRLAFSRMTAESSRLKYSCPALNLAKNQIYLMSRGRFEDMVPYCLAYPPLFRPWQGNVAAVREVPALADQLRRQGANVIILVNVLGAPDPRKPLAGGEGSAEAVLWAEIASVYSKPFRGVQHVISLPMTGYGMSAFGERHEIIRKGSAAAAQPLKGIARQLGL